MKKTFKRSGVAVLTMAMLLSMGAVAATTASAAGESIKVEAGETSTGLTAGDAVSVYKVASSSSSGWAWETAFAGIAGLPAVTDLNDTNVGATASLLARNLTGVAATKKGTVGTAIDGIDKGYYLVIAAPKDAGKVAQPMLIEVKDGTAAVISTTKVGPISLTKVITEVDDATGTAKADHVQDTGKNAQAASGDMVNYRIVAQIPAYDADVVAANITPFVLTDKSDRALTSDENSFKVTISADKDAAADTTGNTYLNRTDGQNFTVTLDGTTVKSNMGKYVIVEFKAEVGENPTISKGLGVRDDQADAAGKGADANKNDVVLTYGNNYSTGGGSDTDGDGDVDDKDDQPELKDYADVYVTALRINKTFGTSAVKAAAGEAKFALYDAAGANVIRSELPTDADGKVSFLGLDAGTYTIKETYTKDGFVKAADLTVTVSSSTPYATFTAAGWTEDATNGGFETTVNNPELGTLPGTGGMGTVLFTVGGAAIVLLAGAMFVVYMRKRRNEE